MEKDFPMSIIVRHFRSEDYAAVEGLSDTIYPEYRALLAASNGPAWRPAMQFDDNHLAPYQHIAVDVTTQQLVAYGAIRTRRLPYTQLDLMVAPAWQKRGIGSLLFEQLTADLMTVGAYSVHARVHAVKSEALAFLKHRGFAERHRMYGLRLNIKQTDTTPYLPLLGRIAAQGIVVTTLANERANDPNYLRKLHALYNTVIPDWPDPDPAPFTPREVEDIDNRLAEADPLPDALFIAKGDDTYLGFSGMFAIGTAVRPDYRGQGLATALKVYTIEYAKQHGYATAITCTANPAMVAVNEKLGYQHELTEVRLLKMLKAI